MVIVTATVLEYYAPRQFLFHYPLCQYILSLMRVGKTDIIEVLLWESKGGEQMT